MEENWRDVPGYEGLYQISIDTKEGRCRSLNYRLTGRIKLLSNTPNKKSGRVFWTLCKEGKVTSYQAGRWIALTFPELIENEYFEGAEIDHKDTNRTNNEPSNLRWVTHKGNLNNSATKQHLSVTMIGKKQTEETKRKLRNNTKLSNRVFQYTLEGEYVNDYPSVNEAERQTGIASTHISACCLGKRKATGGYVWKYNKITA